MKNTEKDIESGENNKSNKVKNIYDMAGLGESNVSAVLVSIRYSFNPNVVFDFGCCRPTLYL